MTSRWLLGFVWLVEKAVLALREAELQATVLLRAEAEHMNSQKYDRSSNRIQSHRNR